MNTLSPGTASVPGAIPKEQAMAFADSKKAQTIANLWYTMVAQPILNAESVADLIEAAIVANGLEGEFSVNERNAFAASRSDLEDLAATNGIANAATRYTPTHAVEQDTVGLEV